MKLFDEVKVINNNYEKKGVFLGMVGTIIQPEIREDSFLICFIDPITENKSMDWIKQNLKQIKDDIITEIKIKDLTLHKKGFATDQMILEDLPKNNPKWWCKVEDGYIKNLLGERKNKIPYDYES